MNPRFARLGQPVLAPLLILHLAAWLSIGLSDHLWLGSWKTALDDAIGTIIVTGPILAALTAWSYAMRERTSLPTVVRTSPRAAWGWFLPGLWLLGAAFLSTVLMIVELTVLSRVNGLSIAPRQLVIVPFALLMLTVHGLIGIAIGRRLPVRFAGVAAGAVSFGLFLLAALGFAPIAFFTGGVSGSLVGQVYDLSAVGQLLAMAALLIVCVGCWATWHLLSPGPVLAISAAAVVAALALGQASDLDVEGRLRFAPVSYECQGSGPELCMPAETPRPLPAVQRKLHRLSLPLVEAGARLPERWETRVPGRKPDPRVGSIEISQDTVTSAVDDDAVWGLAHPAQCRILDGADVPEAVLDAQQRLARWIAFRNGLVRAPASTESGAWLRSRESEAWVRSTYRKLERCDTDGY